MEFNELQKVICEAVECKEPYEINDTFEDWKITKFFGYHYGCGVQFENNNVENYMVGWDQYDNYIYLEGEGIETREWKLEKSSDNLSPDPTEIEEILKANEFLQHHNFPLDLFLFNVSQVAEDIDNNYPIYWDKNHEGNREPVMESVPKENLEDCYKVLDELATQLGFTLEVDNEFTGKKYVKFKNTNYTHFIDFTPEMDKDQLEWSIFNNNKLAEQLVWTITNAHDIRTAFINLIIPHMEGLE